MRALAFVVAIASGGTASAEVFDGHALGIAVNEPVGWIDAAAVGVSAYVELAPHHVLRANVATWDHAHELGPGNDSMYQGGRFSDVAISWEWFPRKAYDGFFTDVGALVRHRNTYDIDDFDQKYDVRTNMIAARAMAGWSWLVKERVFISLQGGLSVGAQNGTQSIIDTVEPATAMPTNSRISVTSTSLEGMLRFGFLL